MAAIRLGLRKVIKLRNMASLVTLQALSNDIYFKKIKTKLLWWKKKTNKKLCVYSKTHPNTVPRNINTRAKKKILRPLFVKTDEAGRWFFVFVFISPQNKWRSIFFFYPSNLTLNLNANRSGKYVSYAFFLGWDSLGMQLELAWALCLGLEQGSCSKLYVTSKCWDTFLIQISLAVKIISLCL